MSLCQTVHEHRFSTSRAPNATRMTPSRSSALFMNCARSNQPPRDVVSQRYFQTKIASSKPRACKHRDRDGPVEELFRLPGGSPFSASSIFRGRRRSFGPRAFSHVHIRHAINIRNYFCSSPNAAPRVVQDAERANETLRDTRRPRDHENSTMSSL